MRRCFFASYPSLVPPPSISNAPISPSTPPPSNRKRNSSGRSSVTVESPSPLNHHHPGSYHVTPLTVVDPSSRDLRYSASSLAVGLLTQQPHLMLSGGKDNLGPLAMFEDCVKKLKSLKIWQTQNLSKAHIESALDSLSDWVFESCGSVSLSGLEHVKLRAFLTQVWLPIISRRDFVTGRLDLKYEDSRAEAESRIQDAMFFQIASDGWKFENSGENLTRQVCKVKIKKGTYYK